MDFSQFNDAERNHLQRVMEQKQESCVQKCADKFLKHSERVGQRFAEANAEMMGGPK
ncbi:protein transporter tim9 [Entomortierella chlamydospora]|uniref:Mitochondrial import inner membrane translocase subunit n=1 Tax=Entomortierella chlamydospora TaxID=101097 RepID=A0A9P6MV90_9FUNG|nr:protein transporter tim9 [Entomortierella chlamydospora]